MWNNRDFKGIIPWILLTLVPCVLTIYELYQMYHLSSRINKETAEVNSLKGEFFSLNQDLERRNLELKRILSENEKIKKKIKHFIKYTDVASLNSIVTKYLLDKKLEIISFTTLEEERGKLRLVFVKLSAEGNEKEVLDFLSDINFNLPMKIRKLELKLPSRKLLVELVFEVPLINRGV